MSGTTSFLFNCVYFCPFIARIRLLSFSFLNPWCLLAVVPDFSEPPGSPFCFSNGLCSGGRGASMPSRVS